MRGSTTVGAADSVEEVVVWQAASKSVEMQSAVLSMNVFLEKMDVKLGQSPRLLCRSQEAVVNENAPQNLRRAGVSDVVLNQATACEIAHCFQSSFRA